MENNIHDHIKDEFDFLEWCHTTLGLIYVVYTCVRVYMKLDPCVFLNPPIQYTTVLPRTIQYYYDECMHTHGLLSL